MKFFQVVFIMCSFFLNKSHGVALEQVSEERVREDVKFLTSTSRPRNYRNTKVLEK
jgi:hypothetical protein